MHELFITALVADVKQRGVLAILQGLCAMTPVEKLEYRLLFEGPRSLPFVGVGKDLSSRKSSNLQLWKELGVQLSRQSYYLNLSYDVENDAMNHGIEPRGEDTSPSIKLALADKEGTLQFLDFPDPPVQRTFHSRLAIILKDETHLPAFLTSCKYRYVRDSYREAYYTYRDNTTFCLSRDLSRAQQDTSTEPASSPEVIPPKSEFTAFDPEMKWIFTATVEVSDGNKPDLVRTATEQLERVKHDFEGIVDFVMVPRQKLDPRIQIQR